ncbi:hypothetical protein HPB50_006300 [Hyalomma asiaticum]|uniref:Uncharacterized protein n=1 Tax=Hyalomma asiaticum TaxID=266040 RepID=A0ACB7SEK1_HYAAI|nr:hypothetical protein HPB50_006300 [Hyalomma asiaticum]
MTSMAPDVILLQEPNCIPSLSGFEAYGSDSGLIGTLVSNRLTTRLLVVTTTSSRLPLLSPAPAVVSTIRMTNWDKFRELRIASPEVDGYDDWLAGLSADLEPTTRSINTTPTNLDVDPHLLHLWGARRGLTKRWKRQRLNRRLKVRIARITREAQEYAQILMRNNWRGFCNSLSGTLSTAKTWSILQALIDPSGTKRKTQKRLHVLTHSFRDSPDRLLQELKARYIPTGASPQYHPKDPPPDITVLVEGTLIPQVERARILGLYVQADGRAGHTISLLSRQTERVIAMFRRVTNRRSGLGERDMLRLVEACILSRFSYHRPFHRLRQGQRDRVDTLIRKAIKVALGVPHYTTQRLLSLGGHNTLSEVLEAQWISQRQRLFLTPMGRQVLTSLGHPVPPAPPEMQNTSVPVQVAQVLRVHPLPRNMHPERNTGRRRAR